MKDKKFKELADVMFACGLSKDEMQKLSDIVLDLTQIEFTNGLHEGARIYEELLRKKLGAKAP